MSGGTTSRRTGRPPLTDRSALLAAAHAQGFAGLTVGTVTTAVGVKYSTFYRHFPSLDALVTALVDRVCEQELTMPDTGLAWQAQLGDACRALTELLERYPGMAAAVVALPELPVQVVSLYRHLTDTLVAAGFDADHAALGATCALEIVTVTGLTTPGAGRSSADRQRRLAEADPPVDPDVRAVTAGLTDGPAGAWTARKIGLLVRGLESALDAGDGRR